MTMLAAKVFLMCLADRLNAPFGGNLAPGYAGERLAREFREGLSGMMSLLEQEAADTNERGRVQHYLSLNAMLMSVWVTEKDSQDLKIATGRTRQQWLDAPIWNFREPSSPVISTLSG